MQCPKGNLVPYKDIFLHSGILAFEMARQLKAQGKTVNTIALFDTYVFPEYYFPDMFRKKGVKVVYVLGKVVFALGRLLGSVNHFKMRLKNLKESIGDYLKSSKKAEKLELSKTQPLELDKM